MKMVAAFTCLAALIVIVNGDSATLNPVEAAVGLLTTMQGKIVAEGESSAVAYGKYKQWCEESTQEKAYEIKVSQRQQEKLEADIEKATSNLEEATAKIDELSESVSTLDDELKSATAVRDKESAVFKADEKELDESIGMLASAIEVLAKRMEKGASEAELVQTVMNTPSLQKTIMGLKTIVEAAGAVANDDNSDQLTALLQGQSKDEMDGESLSAPASAAYQDQSGGIVEVMEDLRDKSEGELRQAREAEQGAEHNYKLKKQSLKDRSTDAAKELDDQKKNKAASEEKKASKDGDLTICKEQLKDAQTMHKDLQAGCILSASDHETSIAARKEEMTVVTKAKKTIQAAMAALVQQPDSSPSFLQMTAPKRASKKLTDQRQTVGRKAVQMVKGLAVQYKSAALAQLASRVSAAVRYGATNSEDPFSKVKSMITDMVARLESEASSDATEKAFCDKELAETSKHQAELDDESESLSSKLNEAMSASATLKRQCKDTQIEIGKMERLSAAADEARKEEHADFLKEEEDLKVGLKGLRTAKEALQDYYASDKDESLLQTSVEEGSEDDMATEMSQPEPPKTFSKASGGGAGIIALLEVCEADSAKAVAELQAEEADGQSTYEKAVQENKVAKTGKEADINGKTQQYKSLDKSISELKGDLATSSQELAAINDYLAKLKERCLAKPEAYEERAKRREAEIKGLQDALASLGADAFLQQHT